MRIQKTLKLTLVAWIVLTCCAFTFQKNDLIEINDFLHARSAAYFRGSDDVLYTLSKGTEGKIEEVRRFASGNYGLRIDVLNGPYAGKGEVWVLWNHEHPSLELLNASGDTTPKPAIAEKAVTLRPVQAVADPAPTRRELVQAVQVSEKIATNISEQTQAPCATCATADPDVAVIAQAILSSHLECDESMGVCYPDIQDSILARPEKLADPSSLVPALERAAKDPSLAVREAAVAVAARIGDAGIPLLISGATGADPKLRSYVANTAFTGMGKKAIPVLAAGFRKFNTDDRFFIADNLRELGTPAMSLYQLAINDPSADVRDAAISNAEVLGAQGRDLLDHAASDPSPKVRASAAEAAPAIVGHSGALTYLQDHGMLTAKCKKSDGSDECEYIRQSAMIAARDVIDADSARTLQILQAGANDESPVVRQAVAQFAGEIGPKVGWSPVVPMLEKLVRDPNRDVKLQAAHAADFAGESGKPVCALAQQDGDAEIQAIGRGGCAH